MEDFCVCLDVYFIVLILLCVFIFKLFVQNVVCSVFALCKISFYGVINIHKVYMCSWDGWPWERPDLYVSRSALWFRDFKHEKQERGKVATHHEKKNAFFTNHNLKLCLPIPTGSQGQFPITQNVTVVEGGTANMTCRVDYNDNTSLQWSNPAQQTLFFGDKKGEWYSIRIMAVMIKWWDDIKMSEPDYITPGAFFIMYVDVTAVWEDGCKSALHSVEPEFAVMCCMSVLMSRRTEQTEADSLWMDPV